MVSVSKTRVITVSVSKTRVIYGFCMQNKSNLWFLYPKQELFMVSGKKKLYSLVKLMVSHRKKNPPKHGEELLLDILLDYTEDEELQLSDGLVYVIGGFHTTGNCM